MRIVRKVHLRAFPDFKGRGVPLMVHEDLIQLLGCDIGGAKELGVIYFPTNWGAKEPQNLPNHRVD